MNKLLLHLCFLEQSTRGPTIDRFKVAEGFACIQRDFNPTGKRLGIAGSRVMLASNFLGQRERCWVASVMFIKFLKEACSISRDPVKTWVA